MSSSEHTPPNKFRKLNRKVETPTNKVIDATIFDLEYTKNPTTGEVTEGMKLTCVLKAGLKNPKGLIESAWNGANLREKWWYVCVCARYCLLSLIRVFALHAGITTI